MNHKLPTFDFNNPRQERVLMELILSCFIWREDVDRIAKASNGPQVIMELRRRGWRIKCHQVKKTDSDGRRCRPGFYWLHPNHISKAKEVLAQAATCASGSSSNAEKQKNPSNGF